MGDRGQVHIEDTGIFLYTHWRGYKLREITQIAMSKGRSRWTDPEYLARIIFSEMIKEEIDETTGYGIGNQEYLDLNYGLIKINCEKQMVNCLEFQYHGTRRELVEHRMTFEEFVKS